MQPSLLQTSERPIAGSSTTVSGKSDTATFAAGLARPIISDGEFTRQRRTGNHVTFYVISDVGATTSNRVTIYAL